MNKLNPEKLMRLHWDMSRFMAVRFQDEITPGEPVSNYHLMLCGGTACHASKGLEIKKRLLEEIESRGLGDRVLLVETGCNGFCAQGPVMNVFPGGIFYQFLEPDHAALIIEEHILKGQPVESLMYHDLATGKPLPHLKDIPFFARQSARVLRNRGLIAAEDINDYIGVEGYLAAMKALLGLTPEEIIREVRASGIRGRGGAGFPTWLKWDFASKSKNETKYILCNADEGDPGAFMDRSVLEADPHSVVEGMIIAAKAIGAHQGYIYCRAEYPLAVKRLGLAIRQAKENGLLGQDILGSGFDLDLDIYRGAGAFVCGEETALITSIEGKRGMPRPRPPFPAVQGLWKKPTVLNNVETLSSIPQIILKGGKWYAGLGTLRSKGTKIFAITGDIRNVGLAEVPMGMSLGNLIYDVAGGMNKNKKFKAVQLGGPSGGCVPARHLNAPVDYESIVQLGAIVGSGGMIVMDEDKCMVDVARFFMEFCVDESCGKCAPCRVGTRQMLRILTRICEGQGCMEDLDVLEKWASIIQNTSLCGLGQTAPNPVLSTLKYFRHEYVAHIKEKRCPAVVCTHLFDAPCQHTCPAGMDVPGYVSLVRAGRYNDAYRVMLRTNPFPSVCGRVCDHQCEAKCRRNTLDEAVHVKYLKRFITDYAKPPKVIRPAVTRMEKVAVIGAGPSGLAAARELAYRGYTVTVFEELPEPGGMLRYGIPAYRLPRNLIKAEIDNILALGVQLRCNTRIGQDRSWHRILTEYDAVYVAVGAHRSQRLGVDGDHLSGVVGAVEFLREVNLGHKPEVGKQVVVVGGGNSAVDAARTALRMGAEQVTLLYRRLKEDMPAQGDEIRAAEEEGVHIQLLAAPLRIVGEFGHVEKMVCQRMALGDFDSSGRRRPMPIAGAEFAIATDQVITAISQRPMLRFLEGHEEDDGVRVSEGGLVELPEGGLVRQGQAMIFAGGDAVTGPSTVIWAIAAGRQAAEQMDQTMRRRRGEPPFVSVEEHIDIPKTVDEDVKESRRAIVPEMPVAERIKDFSEVELGFSEDVAIAEACRCLRCDVKEIAE
jgi:NADH-quinone oxidoreductase subunit F